MKIRYHDTTQIIQGFTLQFIAYVQPHRTHFSPHPFIQKYETSTSSHFCEAISINRWWFNTFSSSVLCNICLFIVCRASFSLLFPLISNTYTRKKNRIYIFLSILFFFACLCLSTMHVLNRKIFPSFFLSRFCSFYSDFIFHVESELTHKCLETTCVSGAHITHNKWGKRRS